MHAEHGQLMMPGTACEASSSTAICASRVWGHPHHKPSEAFAQGHPSASINMCCRPDQSEGYCVPQSMRHNAGSCSAEGLMSQCGGNDLCFLPSNEEDSLEKWYVMTPVMVYWQQCLLVCVKQVRRAHWNFCGCLPHN